MSVLRAVSFALMLLAMTNAGFGREWKDATGAVSREGEFLGYWEGSVWVLLPDGNRATAAWDRLSAADQSYVRRLVNAQPRPAAATSKAATPKTPVRLANFQTAAAPPSNVQQSEPAARPSDARTGGESDERNTYGKKFVFRTHCGTFYIFRGKSGVKPIVGMGRYSLSYGSPPCCGCWCFPCCGPCYLSFLEEAENKPEWLEVHDVGGDPQVEGWRFYWEPSPWGHRIEYHNRSGWHLYGYACVSTPK